MERLLQLIPVMLGISVIVFAMITLTPGDPVDVMLADTISTAEQEAALRRDMGLDLPVHERFLRYSLVIELQLSHCLDRPQA